MANGCNNCGAKSLVPLGKQKLGKCRSCILLSAVGSILGWAIFAANHRMFPSQRLNWIFAVFATGFSILLISHAVAAYLHARNYGS